MCLACLLGVPYSTSMTVQSCQCDEKQLTLSCFESDQSVGRTKDCGVNLHLLQGITFGLLCKVLQAMQWNHKAAHSWVQSHED